MVAAGARWCCGSTVLCREVFRVQCEEAAYALLVCVWGSCNRGGAAAVAQMLPTRFSVVLEPLSVLHLLACVLFRVGRGTTSTIQTLPRLEHTRCGRFAA